MLTKEKMQGYLCRIGDELAAKGLVGDLILAGGASMCLVHSARDMTKDIDALYEPKDVINEIAALIAKEDGLDAGWLNDGVKGFITDTARTEEFLSLNGLRVATVAPEYLLAMKLVSGRYGEQDYSDARFLMVKLGIRTVERAREVVLTYYSPERILPKTAYIIEEIVADIAGHGDGDAPH